jgi:KaiC/GvpD/RAD55 family RecA-like ATPase
MQKEVVDELYSNYELAKLFMPFFNKKPTSLLIRGDPGVGKTTLALELLRMVKNYYKPLYISTRVSLEKLMMQYPWMTNIIKEGDIFSSDKFDKSGAIDMRLSTAKSLLEVVINTILDNKNVFIILDSWDSLAKESTYEERIKMEKSMVSIADTNDGFIIFISEEPDKNTTAYITDAIISLSVNKKNGFAIRNMSIDKMRGVAVEYKTRLYTLLNTHFLLLPSKQELSFSDKVYNTNLKDVSTGNAFLDDILSNLNNDDGVTILIETSSNIDRKVIGILLSSFVIHNLKKKRHSFVITAPHARASNVLKYIKPFCHDEELSNLTFFTHIKDEKSKLYNVIRFDEFNYSKNIGYTFMNYYIDKSYNVNHPIIMTYDMGIRELWSPDNTDELIKITNNLVKLAKENCDILILLTRPQTKTLNYARNVCDIYMKTWVENNVPILWIRRPEYGIYSFIYDNNMTKNYYDLIKLL